MQLFTDVWYPFSQRLLKPLPSLCYFFESWLMKCKCPNLRNTLKDTFIVTEKLRLIGLRGLLSISKPVETPCKLRKKHTYANFEEFYLLSKILYASSMKLDQTLIWSNSNFIWLNLVESATFCSLKRQKDGHIDKFRNLVGTILSTAIWWINSFSQTASILLFKLANFDELKPFLIFK